MRWGRNFPFLQQDSDIFHHNQCSTGINFWTYPTGPNMGFQWDEEGMLPFYNETQTFSVTTKVQLVSAFEHTQLVLIWVFGEMRSVPFLQWESDSSHHNQCLMGINFWTYPTGPNIMGFFAPFFHTLTGTWYGVLFKKTFIPVWYWH